MQAVEISSPGEPDVLTLVTRDTPQPAANEVVIRVAAAGVNRPDCLQRRGLYPPPPGASDLPGLEVAGQVVATGDAVTDIASGAEVCALLAGGGYAEYCAVPAVQCLPVPENVSLIEAATLPETFFTVWTNVFELGALQAGERLLVHGGAIGIGTTAIQLATALGAEVFATAGSDDKTKLCEQLGARRGINYKKDNFREVIKAECDGQGVDVILDIVGGSYLEDNIKLMNRNGRLVVIGILGGAKGTANLGLILSKQLTVTGSTLRPRPPEAKGRIAASLKQQAWPLFANGQLRPVVQQTYPLAAASAAHTLLEANEAAGKLVLITEFGNGL
ncbi:MAG: NAD(P)H-quinone oxidoreductase [Gammaproteobacteria bacterium]